MQEAAQGTGHTPEVLTHTSKLSSTKASLCPLHQPQARVPCLHTLAGPEHHHPPEPLSTCWVTKCHLLHWFWLGCQRAWLAPGAWQLLCLLLGYVTGIPGLPVSSTQCLSQPNPFLLGASESHLCGWNPWPRKGSNFPTTRSRGCLLGGQR